MSMYDILVLRETVPAAFSRLWEPEASTYAVLNSLLCANLDSTIVTVHLKTCLEDQTIGSIPDTGHISRIAIPPGEEIEMLSAAVLLEAGESICLSQEGSSYRVVIRANGVVYNRAPSG